MSEETIDPGSAAVSGQTIRADFPILAREVNGAPLTYLDNAATSQKPVMVLDAERRYYEEINANVHRAAHRLADDATAALEGARDKVARLLGAAESREIIFTRGATEAINLVAASLAERIQPDDTILISELEHHANIVPWQMLAARTGARLIACPATDAGDMDMDAFHRLLGPRTRIAAFAQIGNALGNVNPVAQLVKAARSSGALSLVDGAQAIQHLDINVRDLGCDFYVCSAHKAFGPTGIGALYGRAELLEAMPPWQGGGEMIERVTLERTDYNELPWKFEAGTPNIAGAVGFGAAVDYLNSIPRTALARQESRLVAEAVARLRQIQGLRIIGEPQQRSAIVSFLPERGHPQDIGALLDQQGVAVRTGHHCAMPLMQRLGIDGTVRASFALYNVEADLDRLMTSLDKALSLM